VEALAAARAGVEAARAAAAPAVEARSAEVRETFDRLRSYTRETLPAGPESRAARTADETLAETARTQQRELRAASRVDDLVRRTLADAADALTRLQADELSEGPTAAAQDPGALDRDQAARREALVELTQRAEAAMTDNAGRMRARQGADAQRVAAAVVSPEQDESARLANARAREQGAQTVRTARRLLDHVRQETRAVLERPSPARTTELRARTGVADDVLDDEALARVAAAARGTDPGDRLNRARGAVTEELNNARVQAQLRETGDAALELVAGHRARDGMGRQLADGLVLRRLEDGTRRVEKAFEVKAGAPGARELLERRDDLSRADQVELVRFALDLAREDVAAALPEGAPGAAASTDAAARAALLEEALERRVRQLQESQRESGQLARTLERLHQQRLFVDGVEVPQAIDDLRPAAEVQAVLAQDTELRRRAAADEAADATETTNLVRLVQDEAEIRRIAQSVVDLVEAWAREDGERRP
ncbi:hypothetical protein ICW40_06450, partial [Actinotalea ferrariae]|uniref:hypothetical protein n=1 Tax=Actinotalea ferrariae TaxID=1386098 RepID=UPI001EC128BF|nr:hypothetical protein [Actinotalea ferrariae]